jgi:RHS repeat-associated protein
MHISKRTVPALFGLILALPGPAQTAVRRVSFSGVTASGFEEPLVATTFTSPQEDDALLGAVEAYRGQASPDNFGVFDAFLSDYPRSGWRAALLTNLGLAYYHYGYFSKAIDSWEQAWQVGREANEPRARALVDRAVGELVRMHARLGHAGRLSELLDETNARHVTGPATEALAGGKEGLWMMQHNPGVAYLCGPMALKNLLLLQGARPAQLQFLDDYRSGPRGVTLAEVARLASEAKLGYRLVFRQRGQATPAPSIVHWKVGHFAAIVGESGDRLHIVDPTFGEDLWITRGALDAESSGYFLAPGGEPAAGWREVGRGEAEAVRGMGFVSLFEYLATTLLDRLAKGPPKVCHGMCGYDVTEMLVSLRLSDTPAGYAPPRGPAVFTTLVYNQREAGQPANFSFFNVSAKWTLNWLSYIQDDPKLAGANVSRYATGGGGVTYSGYSSKTGAFTPDTRDASLLVRTNASPVTYERRMADGGREVYAQSDGAATFPRKVFLTQIFDAAGNAITLIYESQNRLASIQDALGRATMLSYELASQPLLVTRITDPFGRSAKLDYDAKGRLVQITDVAGLTSQFTYDASSLINSMTTPYGTTKFAYGETGTYRWLEATDPLGYTERVEFQQEVKGIPFSDPNNLVPKGILAPFNQYLSGRDTFYWDKHAHKLANGDHTMARTRHWTHVSSNINMVSHTVESYKMPFENRVWHNYPGQPDGGIGTALSGTLDYPSLTGRVLDDGTTQLSQIAYNSLGKPTGAIDPVGRQTLFTYDPNQIDLLKVQQKTAAGNATVASFTYNSQHEPLTYTDAAGQTTTYAYDVVGNLIQATDPLGLVTKYEYNSGGYLTRLVDPNGKTATSLTYDSAGRIATRTDSEGLTVSYSYDALDRITQETYPDGTTRQYTWNKLDLASVKDRRGRTTQYTYDAVRNLTDITDPMGRQTQFTYYENGLLKSLIDPTGNVTTWTIDLQNRVTGKQYADGSQWSYTYEKTTSRLKSITDALGQVKQYNYTQDDQLAGIDYANAVNPTPSVRFAYDPSFRRVVSMTDGGGTRAYQYQPLGSPGALSLAQESGPYQNDGIGYQYDALGRLIGRTVDTNAETFAYDSLSRLTSHLNALGAFDLSYLGETGQITSRQLRGAAARTAWSYDTNTNDRRLTAISNSGAARGYQYTTTPEYIISHIAETATSGAAAPTQAWDYTYDPADRLLQGISSGGLQYAYAYDADDNLMSQQGATGAMSASYNAVNQITNLGSGQAFVYDANGNLTDDGVRTYNWDAENRLIGIVSKADSTQVATFRYDGLGRRIAIVGADGVETRYLWCGEALCQARGSDDTVSRRYYSEGELAPGGASLFYAQDHLGSVRDVLSAQDGSLVTSNDYDAYGNPIQAPGFAATDFRYAGMFYERNSGLYLTHYRAYDPVTARWLSRDPIEERGGMNLYSYGGENPLNSGDPTGLDAILLNQAGAANGHGHAAILVGNNAVGYNYYATYDTGGEYAHFATIRDFFADPRFLKYDRADYIRTTFSQDLRMIAYGGNHYKDPYSVFTNNCADLAGDILLAGDIFFPNQTIHELPGLPGSGVTEPNKQFQSAIENHVGRLFTPLRQHRMSYWLTCDSAGWCTLH